VKLLPAGTRDRYVDLVCAGWSLQAATDEVGASVGKTPRRQDPCG
jgi:hypothetical protein